MEWKLLKRANEYGTVRTALFFRLSYYCDCKTNRTAVLVLVDSNVPWQMANVSAVSTQLRISIYDPKIRIASSFRTRTGIRDYYIRPCNVAVFTV